ncbi:MAP/microtubule affinity-regulating kinase [Paragonimus westermani]|uniref:non-specific serine/threonine protein kinase n=1 Tax=Paragonimus westermani TaxID=34504 RepID=A0A5J4NYT9_9TREM|nr:MAP/microtubule affinity-regulating kinase [Paragonimus westermani]
MTIDGVVPSILLDCTGSRKNEHVSRPSLLGHRPSNHNVEEKWDGSRAITEAENLLLDGQNNLKLADFGFANQFDSGCNLDTFCGSPPYAAPELLSGKKYHGPEVDVWALGVILYMLVCGKLPFEAYTLKELHTRVLTGKYQIPFYMSGACESMLKQMLVIDPKKRSTLKELMQQSWINIGYEREPLQPFVETEVDYNDPIRRALMSQLGFNPDDLRDAFENGCFDNVTATYLLLADTETRHKVTNRLQNQMHANSTILADPDGTDYLGDDNDDETKHERSSSAFGRSGQTADVQSRTRGSWVTGSLRNHNSAQDNDKYMKQTKQFCRPSLNLPKLIAYVDGNSKATDDDRSQIKTAEDPTYNRGDDDTSTADHTEESSMATPKTNNGLRRIRTSTLDMEDSESEDRSFRPYDLRKKPLIIEHKTRTDPLTRRTLQPEATKMPFPRTRTRSIVIVSDMRDKPNANRQSDIIFLSCSTLRHRSVTRLSRIGIADNPRPANQREEPIDLLNPVERERFYRTKLTNNLTNILLPNNTYRDQRSTDYGQEKRRLDTVGNTNGGRDARFGYHGRDTAGNNNGGVPNIIRTSVNSGTTVMAQSTFGNATFNQPTLEDKPTADRPNNRWNHATTTVDSDHDEVDAKPDVQISHLPQPNRTDRFSKWRRHTTESPVVIEKKPSYKSSGNTSSSVHREQSSAPFPTSNTETIVNGSTGTNATTITTTAPRILSPLTQLKRTMLENRTALPRYTVKRQTPASTPTSPVLYRLGNMPRTLSIRSQDRLSCPLEACSPTKAQQLAESGRNLLSPMMKLRSPGDQRTRVPYQQEPSPIPISRTDRESSLTRVNGSRTPPTNTHHKAKDASINNVNGHYKSPIIITTYTPYNGTNRDGTHARQSGSPTKENRVLSYGRKQDYKSPEQNGDRQSGRRTPSPNSPEDQKRLPTAVPRKQHWTSGIHIQGSNAQILMLSLLRVLEDYGIGYVYLSPYRLQCTRSITSASSGGSVIDRYNSIPIMCKWEMEVVQLPRSKSYGVRFKYISGDTTQYRSVERLIIAEYPKSPD